MLEELIQEMRDLLSPLPAAEVEAAVSVAVAELRDTGRSLAIAIYFEGISRQDVNAGLDWWRGRYKEGLLDNGIDEQAAEQVSQLATDIVVQEAYSVSLHMSAEGGHA